MQQLALLPHSNKVLCPNPGWDLYVWVESLWVLHLPPAVQKGKKRKNASLAVGINVRLLWWGCDRLQPLCAPELDKWKGNGWMDKYILKTHKTKKPTLTFYERENFIIRKTTIYVFIYFTSCTPTAPHYFHKLPLSLLSSISIMFL